MNSSTRRYLLSFSALVWCGLAVAVASGQASVPAARALAPLIGLSIAAEALVVRQRRKGEGEGLSFSVTAHIAAAVLFGPVTAALLAAFAVVVVDGVRLQPRLQILFNSSMFAAAIWTGGSVYGLLGGSVGSIGGTTCCRWRR
jgi:hypothetical protein